LQEALEEARKAQNLDPTSAVIASNLAGVYLQLGNNEEAERYAQVARQLGIAPSTGIDADIAMQRGEWDRAKELLLAQEQLPAELRPFIPAFVDAVRDPARRPATIEEMRKLDPRVAKQTELIAPYLALGAIDDAYRVMFDALDRNDPWSHDWDLSHVWGEDGRKFRTDPRFAQLAERLGIVDYWKQYGFPDQCKSGTDTPVVCS
jgi:hypothetical protein